jgi:transcriptional regulator with XRE-family HTH domain
MVYCFHMTRQDFPEWLEKQLQARDWKPADLARATGLGSSTLSNILNRNRNASLESVTLIARALGKRPEPLLRIAGLLPPSVDDLRDENPVLDDICNMASRLSAEEQQFLFRMLHGLVQDQLSGQVEQTLGDAPSPAQEQPAAPEAGETELDRFGSEQFYALMDIAEDMGTDALLKIVEILTRRLQEQRREEEKEKGVGEAKGEQRPV